MGLRERACSAYFVPAVALRLTTALWYFATGTPNKESASDRWPIPCDEPPPLGGEGSRLGAPTVTFASTKYVPGASSVLVFHRAPTGKSIRKTLIPPICFCSTEMLSLSQQKPAKEAGADLSRAAALPTISEGRTK